MNSAMLVATKTQKPISRPNLVDRQRLIMRMNEGLDSYHRMTVVYAPAGFGKTTLVLEWLRQVDLQSIWFSIDEGDNDPIRFWEYVIAAFQSVQPDIGKSMEVALQASRSQNLTDILASLINDLSASLQMFVLVLDGYHFIKSQAVNDSLNYFLNHIPSQVYLVITSREVPTLHLPGLKARGMVLEVKAADLRFTQQESQQFLNQTMALPLTKEQIAALDAKTNGWVAALQLAAISLRDNTQIDAFIRSYNGTSEGIMSYLIEEVLSTQPEDVQAFLLQTSILSRFNVGLCQFVYQGRSNSRSAGEILSYLREQNLFVLQADAEMLWFRYYQLFADLLNAELFRRFPQIVTTLHREASRWFEQNQMPAEAISHALSTRDEEFAASLLEKHIFSLIDRSEVAQAHHYLRQASESILQSRPLLCLLDALTMFTIQPPYSVDQIEQRLADADALLSTWNQEGAELVIKLRDTMRVLIAHDRGMLPQEIIEKSLHLLAGLPKEYARLKGGLYWNLGRSYQELGNHEAAIHAYEEIVRYGEETGELYLRMIALTNLCQIYIRLGHHQEAMLILQEALRHVETRNGQPPITGILFIMMGSILMDWGDIDRAENNIRTGQKMISLTGELDYQALALIRLVEMYTFAGNINQAHQAFEQLRSLETRSGTLPYSLILRLRLWIRQGEAEQRFLVSAQQLLLEKGGDLVFKPERIGVYLQSCSPFDEQLSNVRLQIALHDKQLITRREFNQLGLFDFLNQSLNVVKKSGWDRLVVEIEICLALAYFTDDKTLAACRWLDSALRHAEPARLVFLFWREGELMRSLLSRRSQRNENNTAPPFLFQVLQCPDTIGRTPEKSRSQSDIVPPLVQIPMRIEKLTERELEILHLMAEGKSNQEIADRLVVSLSTVKGHTTNIFGKLGVNSRTQAIARARLFGLLE